MNRWHISGRSRIVPHRPCRLLLVVDPGADSILLDVRKALSESHDDVYEFELKAVEALLSVSSKRLVKPASETLCSRLFRGLEERRNTPARVFLGGAAELFLPSRRGGETCPSVCLSGERNCSSVGACELFGVRCGRAIGSYLGLGV